MRCKLSEALIERNKLSGVLFGKSRMNCIVDISEHIRGQRQLKSGVAQFYINVMGGKCFKDIKTILDNGLWQIQFRESESKLLKGKGREEQ